MNAREFIYQIIKLYRSARFPKFADQKIRRGRSRSIAPLLEDLFAYFLVSRVPCERIYIDQPISVAGIRNQNCPDISIIRNGRITAFCDLKTFLGWKRKNFYDLCRHHYQWLQKVRNKDCKITDGITKEEFHYKIHKNATYNIVMSSNRNIGQKLLNEQAIKAKRFSPDVEIFILTDKGDLNAYKISAKELLEKTKIRKRDFLKLINKLKKCHGR